VTIDDIRRARERLRGVILETPVVEAHGFEGQVKLKAECLQRTGSFKIRGAYNKVRSLPATTRGVICASAGNHAQGVALAAKLVGLGATVVMPEAAPINKIERAKALGAEVVLSGHSLEAAYVAAAALAAERGLSFVHPFDDEAVVTGQATLGLELLDQIPEVSTVLVPVGGGGLIAGVALAIKSVAPAVRVVGVQAEGATAAERSFHAGRLIEAERSDTLADGIRVGRVSALTLDLMSRYVDDIVLVSDEEIGTAMFQLLDREKLVVEGAGAAAYAALRTGRVELRGQTCVVLSGGNVDLNLVARVVERGLTRAGRYAVVTACIADRPGGLYAVVGELARLKVNLIDVIHRRAGFEIPVGMVAVDILVETRDRAHGEAIALALREAGLDAAIKDAS